jgi:hypothetical protein
MLISHWQPHLNQANRQVQMQRKHQQTMTGQQLGPRGLNTNLKKCSHSLQSNCYQKNLPPGPVYTDTTINQTVYKYPLKIKISKFKKSTKQLNHTRLVVAVLAALQKVCKETYLLPREGFGNIDPIKSPAQVSMHPADLKRYLELPSEEQQNSYTIIARLMIGSNIDLEECKNHPKFVEYLAREHIVLDVNALMDVDPEHVGYLERISGRHDTLLAHTSRLKEILPKDSPPFQLNIHSLKTNEGRCKVFMINCDKANLEVIRRYMLELHKAEKVRSCHGENSQAWTMT